MMSLVGPHVDCKLGNGMGNVNGFSMCNGCNSMNTCGNGLNCLGAKIIGDGLH